MTDLLEHRGALFSDDRVYRWRLWRRWEPHAHELLMIMLNPSTADEKTNDPTVERCQVRAIEMGYGSLVVVNIFALRSTDPRALYAHRDPVGEHNDYTILDCALGAAMVLCAWGTHGAHMARGREVESMLRRRPNIGKKLHVLGLNADGSPKHPLYIGYAVRPARWKV